MINPCAPSAGITYFRRNIVKKNRIAVTTNDAEISQHLCLLEPIFGTYQAAFIEGRLSKLATSGKTLKCWDISIDPAGKTSGM